MDVTGPDKPTKIKTVNIRQRNVKKQAEATGLPSSSGIMRFTEKTPHLGTWSSVPD